MGSETGGDAGSAGGAEAGDATTGEGSVSQLLGRMRSLYERTEAATEAYNATEEKLKAQRATTARAQAALARARSALASGRTQAGQLARQQYRGGGAGLPPAMQVLLSPEPYQLLERGHLLKRAAGDQAATVRQLAVGERRQAVLTERARRALKKKQRLTARKKAQRDEVRARLRKVEKLLASLSGPELAELRALESRRTDEAQRELMASGALGGPRDPSGAGQQALDYAMRQLGKPYVWGAEGPGSFDCSGLTSQAWHHARRSIPRTSQEQWRRLPRIPLSKLRPGDLVIYFAGATHVGIYAGAGRVVQAPRPGGVVKISPLASNPPIGAVRPDAST
ncbi:C40 family peptidase [Streptomyces iconiensis]|uniref:C40 family peptidase n=1 Tax=Streptomyces iconiensis TaxID=1384038 RepID=A0ABT7A1N7_9ACTN|nr:C40 family peptidase [Streptomyces iconiensis]MDJ1135232.1 C40 family peptidase [Streptomyces iconiensis]